MKESKMIRKNPSEYRHNGKQSTDSCYLEKTSTFLKQQIGQIIKSELKAYHLKIKLQAELQQYNKQQQNKSIKKSIFQERIVNFAETEKNYRKKQYDQFVKRQKEREEKLKNFIIRKEGNHKIRFANINQTIQSVKERYENIQNCDINFRLSRIVPNTSGSNRINMSTRTQRNSRVVSTSQGQLLSQATKKIKEKKQQLMITNYVNKILKSESRQLFKQIDKINRNKDKISSNKTECLINQRKKKEEQFMEKTEKQYKQRMEDFQINHSRIHENKEAMLMSRSIMNLNTRSKILKKKEQAHKEQIQSIVTNVALKKGKENFMQHYRSVLDLANTKKNRALNLSKMKQEQNEKELSQKMKILKEKLAKVKNLEHGKLEDKFITSIISMIDKTDPQYTNILQFLKCDRKAYIEGIVKKEEEKNKFDKLKKLNRAVSKVI